MRITQVELFHILIPLKSTFYPFYNNRNRERKEEIYRKTPIIDVLDIEKDEINDSFGLKSKIEGFISQ